jgi:hypothetical protein
MEAWRIFFADYFGWRSVFAQVLWSGISLIAVRLALWMWRQPFPRGEAVYWVIGFPALLILFPAISYVMKSGERPRLSGSIDRIQILKASQLTTDQRFAHSMAVLLVASIRNSGTPSMVEGWGLSISIKGAAKRISATAVKIPPALFKVHDTITGEVVEYVGYDALYNKTVFAPIATGAIVRGILLYFIDDVTDSMLMASGTRYHLKFSDILRRTYEVEHVWPAIPTARADIWQGYLRWLICNLHPVRKLFKLNQTHPLKLLLSWPNWIAEAVASVANSATCYNSVKDVHVLTIVNSERKLIEVKRKVLFADVMIGAHNALLQKRPEVFDIVRVNGPANIFPLLMVHARMRVEVNQIAVSGIFIGRYETDLIRDNLFNEQAQGVGAGILDYLSDHVALTGDGAYDSHLAGMRRTAAAVFSSHAGVTVLCLPPIKVSSTSTSPVSGKASPRIAAWIR